MKARTLCLLLASCLATPVIAEGKEKLDFSQSIQETEAQTAAINSRIVESLQQNETVSFYNADWLSLRKRKKRALASVELPLKFKREGTKTR